MLTALLITSALLSLPALAKDVTTWIGLKDAIENSSADTIDITQDIILQNGDGDINVARTLSIVGNMADRYLDGNNAYKGLNISLEGTLNLSNISMKNFANKSTDGDAKGGALYNAGTMESIIETLVIAPVVKSLLSAEEQVLHLVQV